MWRGVQDGPTGPPCTGTRGFRLSQHNTDNGKSADGAKQSGRQSAGGGFESVERVDPVEEPEPATGGAGRTAQMQREQLAEDRRGLEVDDLTFHIAWSECFEKRTRRFSVRMYLQLLIRVKRF